MNVLDQMNSDAHFQAHAKRELKDAYGFTAESYRIEYDFRTTENGSWSFVADVSPGETWKLLTAIRATEKTHHTVLAEAVGYGPTHLDPRPGKAVINVTLASVIVYPKNAT